MPGKNGTGPQGQGPRSGGGRGNCGGGGRQGRGGGFGRNDTLAKRVEELEHELTDLRTQVRENKP